MGVFTKFVVVISLLLILMAVLIRPAIDLPATALRVWQAALLAVLPMVHAAHLAFMRRARVPLTSRFKATLLSARLRADALSLACVRHC